MVNRDSLIDYLLHEMPESERLDFAERWFPDPDLSQQLETAEAELFDAYVRGELPRRQRKRVERYLLDSDVQGRKLAFAAALHGVLPSRRRSVPWLWVAAAAMFAILAGMASWTVRQNLEMRQQIAKLEQVARPIAGGVYTASLASSLRGSSAGSPLVLPKDADMLRLDLEVAEAESHQAYAVTLSASGRVVWREEPLAAKAGGPASFVRFWIPARVLGPGTYTVALESGGSPVAYFSLRIIR
jgi:hypothetical protein